MHGRVRYRATGRVSLVGHVDRVMQLLPLLRLLGYYSSVLEHSFVLCVCCFMLFLYHFIGILVMRRSLQLCIVLYRLSI